VRLYRDMGHYADALAWARLTLHDESPLTGVGDYHAPHMLFTMEAVFDAFVAKHLVRQLNGCAAADAVTQDIALA
jgi:5-methylcytosine-specific restriction enzyme subunit McrC